MTGPFNREKRVVSLGTSHEVLSAVFGRGMSAEEAKSEFIRVTMQLDGYGDEYYPAKVFNFTDLLMENFLTIGLGKLAIITFSC